MKAVTYFLVVVLFFTYGCSPYSALNYSSNEDYIARVNRTLSSRDFDVRLKSDSVLYDKSEGRIFNDTLFLTDSSIPIKDVKEITTTNWNIGAGLVGALAANTALFLKFPIFYTGESLVICTVAGFIAGSIIALLFSWQTTYKMDSWN